MLDQIIKELEETLEKLKAYRQDQEDAILPEQGKSSINDVRRVIKIGLDAGDYSEDTVIIILKKYDVRYVSDLKESDYEKVIADITNNFLVT